MLCAGALSAAGAHASCAQYPGTAERIVKIDFGQVLVPADVGVGGTIATRSFGISAGGTADRLLQCTNGGLGIGVVPKGALAPGYTDVYSTGVTGVGIRIRWGGPYDKSYPFVESYPSNLSYIYLSPGAQLTVELIKTGPVTGNGPLGAGTYSQFRGDGDGLPVVSSTMTASGTRMLTPACSVDTGSRNISVQFGNVPLSSFGGPGSTSASRPFNIVLHCRSGLDAQNAIYLRMDATADASNQPGVLQISQSGGGVATGVGIQVLDKNSTGVSFGDDVPVGPSRDGSYTLAYIARYYQTAARVTAGSANGTATFTLTYK